MDSASKPGFVEYETVIFYEGKRKIEIRQDYRQVVSPTSLIYLYEVDAENRVIEKKDEPLKLKGPDFSFDKKLFDFSRTNREKVVNRVKTILVFA